MTKLWGGWKETGIAGVVVFLSSVLLAQLGVGYGPGPAGAEAFTNPYGPIITNPGTGTSDPTCPCTAPLAECPVIDDGKVHIFDCGANGICESGGGDDFEIAAVMKDANGNFVFPSVPCGHKIYAIDRCFDPGRVGPAFVIKCGSAAPLLSGQMIVVLIASLSLVGLFGLSRLRLSRQRR